MTLTTPSEGQRRPKTLPSRVLRLAKAGSLHALGELCYMVSAENCTLEVLDTVFENLHPELVPQDYYAPGVVDAAEVPFAAMNILGAVAKAAYSRPDLKEALVMRIIDAVETVCSWLDLSLTRGIMKKIDGDGDLQDWGGPRTRPYFLVAEKLGHFLELDPRIQHAFISYSTSLKLLLRLWRDSVGQTKEFLEYGGVNGCPIVRNTRLVTRTPDGKEAIITLLTRFPTLAKSFAISMVERAKRINEDQLDQYCLPNLVRHADNLLDIIFIFVSSSPLVRRELTSAGYITAFTTLLNTLSLRSTEQGASELLARIFRAVWNLIALISCHRSRVVQNRREAALGDMLGLLSRTVRYVASAGDTQTKEDCVNVVKMFADYMVYPKVLKAIHALDLPALGLDPTSKSSQLSYFWKGFNNSFQAWSRMPLPHVVKLCDNLGCRRVERSSTWESRQCSGCSSVVYCSEGCQKEDWKRWHKRECSAARDHHIQQRSMKAWYTHEIRTFHTTFIDAFFSNHMPDIENGRRIPPDLPLNTLFYAVLCHDIDPRIEIVRLDRHQWWTQWDHREFGQTYLNDRLENIGNEFKIGSAHRLGGRLVEVVFPMGADCNVHLTAVVKPVNGGGYHTVYCVPRYGTITHLLPFTHHRLELALPTADAMSAEELKALRDEIEELKLQRTDLRKLSAFHESEASRAQQDAQYLWEGRQSARAEVLRLSALLEAATPCVDEAARWKEEAEALREESRSRKATAESARVTALLTATKKQGEEIMKLNGELDTVKAEMERVRLDSDAVSSRDEEIERLKAELCVVGEELAKLGESLDQATAKLKKALGELTRVAETFQTLWFGADKRKQVVDEKVVNIVTGELVFIAAILPRIGRLKGCKTSNQGALLEVEQQYREVQGKYRTLLHLTTHDKGMSVSLPGRTLPPTRTAEQHPEASRPQKRRRTDVDTQAPDNAFDTDTAATT